MSEEKQPTCEICGEPMPQGEEMFNYHGYSGPCPKPPLAKKEWLEKRAKLEEGRSVEAGAGEQPTSTGGLRGMTDEQLLSLFQSEVWAHGWSGDTSMLRAELLRRLQAGAQGDGWIKVSARKPETAGQYLCGEMSKYGFIQSTQYFTINGFPKWITHWRELPAPPAGAE